MKNYNALAIFALLVLFNLTFAFAAQAASPTNDNFSSAEQLSGIRVSVARTNAEATKEAGEPSHANNVGGKSVWFKWTAPMTRLMRVTTNRSNGNINTLIHVYTGASLNSLSSEAFNNDINSPANYRSFTRFMAIAGTTYYIAVDGYKDGNQPAAEGAFVLDIMPSFQFQGADFDSDGMTDFAYFRPSNGSWNYIETSSGVSRTRYWGTNGDIPVVTSLAGSGRNEFAVFRPSSGTWFYQPFCCSDLYLNWGTNGDKPAAAEFGGSGGNLAVYRPASGEWFIYESQNSFRHYRFGASEDIPVPGNYSPDSFADVAVFRPSNGVWYFMKRQSSNQNGDSFKAVQFGQSGDKPVPADYDGDGLLDVAVYRPTGGYWFVLRSSDNQFQAFQWGVAEDIPATGDYDGDGIFDYAVFRPSNGTWYIRKSSDGSLLVRQHGQSGDIPVTSNYGK